MPKSTRPLRINRRSFLQRVALFATGGLLAACALPQARAIPTNDDDLTYTAAEVPRPQQLGATDFEVDEQLLMRFLALSALLTGVDDLDAGLGRIYLHSLQTTFQGGVTVAELLDLAAGGEGAALPTTLEDVAQRGIFDKDGSRMLADKIIEYWYTGVYDTADGGQALAAYLDTLAWKTLTFTKAPTVCGSYQFWTEPPEAALD